MRLLTGPPGSGKTFTVLNALRQAIRARDANVRVLVPTTTMAQHLRNELAREGLVFSPSAIQTLHRFVESWVPDLPEVSDALFYMLVERAAGRLNLPEFRKVAQLAGFHAKLAAVIKECAAAGSSAGALRKHAPAVGLGRAVAAVYEEVAGMLAERKLGMRASRLTLAAERIQKSGTLPVKSVWLDGFFSLSEPELAVVSAIATHADVTVTLPAADIAQPTRVQLLARGFQEQTLAHSRTLPKAELFVAPGIEREADEIARRILVAVAAGRLFREIGVIVRSAEIYVPLLRATLERFGIPARFYFEPILEEQAAVRYLAGLVDAMLGGWDHEQTLIALKLAPGAGASAPMDRFEFELRKRWPSSGLQPLQQLANGISGDDRRLARQIDRLPELDSWRDLSLTPEDWVRRLMQLRQSYWPPRPRDAVTHEAALAWRSQFQAITAFEAAIAEAARAFDPAVKIALHDFWPAVKAALRLMPLRVADQRRNVVHVLSAYEARQWDLAVVFVCGLVEGQFPRYPAADPFLPEAARRRLKEHGLRIRTCEENEREERFLFESAMSRATEALVVSYPKNDARGEQNLPSLYLDPAYAPHDTRPVRVQSPYTPCPAGISVIRSHELVQIVAQKHAEVRPTALESYLQCPFQFFAGHTLRLEGAPLRPEERLDFLARGIIVHGAISDWLQFQGAIEEILERRFRETVAKNSIPPSYQAEMLRTRMLQDLRRFVASERWPADCQNQSEITCHFKLEGGLAISCRIDRVIRTNDGGAYVIDYKYSNQVKDKVKNENLLQGPLYWLAAERGLQLRPQGMLYCGVRDAVEYAGWGMQPDCVGRAMILPFTPEWLEDAVARSTQAAQAISQGRIAPNPTDPSKCRLCDFKDVCRYESAVAAAAEGA